MKIWNQTPNGYARKAKTALIAVALWACVCCAAPPADLSAQSTVVAEAQKRTELPDAPLPQGEGQNQPKAIMTEGSSSFSGTAQDSTGADLADVQVTLRSVASGAVLNATASATGDFTFSKLPAGRYLITVTASGFQTFQSPEILLEPGQDVSLPPFLLQIAEADSSITVRPTEVVAAEQIRDLEKQRFLGVLPNFYTSYIYNAAPMTAKQKFSLAARNHFDPISFIGIAITAGIEQSNDKFPGYGNDAASYGKRFAAKYGDGLTSDYLSHAVFPVLFHQDPRYFVQGSGTTKSRLIHALSSSVIARGDNGRNMPNYSYFLGDISSGALSNLYYPHADRGMGLVFTNAAIGIAGKAGGNVLKEFFSKPLTTHVRSAPMP